MTSDQHEQSTNTTHHEDVTNTPNEPEETLAQRVQNMSLMLVVMTPLLTGIGYLDELGKEKEDQRLLSQMTEAQRNVVTLAAENDTCGTLRHNFARICWKQQEDTMPMQNSVATVNYTSINPEDPAL